jgi:hypothetical protein
VRSPLALAAADYLNRGLAVIALTGKMPNGKVHRHGLNDCITGPVETPADWALIEGAFDHPDTTGIGILTRWPLVVVDIDGEEGAQQYADMVPNWSAYSAWTATTGRGMHLYFASAQPTGTIKLGPKLDLKGDGGYVAAPPSQHPSGATYQWIREPGEALPEVPEAIAEAIANHAYDLQMAMERKQTFRGTYGPKYNDGDTVFYAQASHEPLIEGMREAVEGNRNAYLHWAAATLSEEGAPTEEFEQLAEAALAAGLEPIEIKRTIRSARRGND